MIRQRAALKVVLTFNVAFRFNKYLLQKMAPVAVQKYGKSVAFFTFKKGFSILLLHEKSDVKSVYSLSLNK